MIGEKEQKVIETQERYKKILNNSIAKLEKAIKKGEITALTDNSVSVLKRCIEANLALFDETWDFVKETLKDHTPKYSEIRNFQKAQVFSKSNENYPIFDIEFFCSSREEGWDIHSITNINTNVDYLFESIYKRLEAIFKDRKANAKADKASAKEKKFNELKAKFYEIKIGSVPALTQFLDDWKKSYIEYYTNKENKETARIFKESTEKEYFEYDDLYSRDRKNFNYATWKKYKDAYTKCLARYNLFYRTSEQLQKDASDGANYLEAEFIWAVAKYCEDIENVELYFNHGKLNGVVIGKDDRRWNVDTIMAGGYNIQCLHLRTLIHEIE